MSVAPPLKTYLAVILPPLLGVGLLANVRAQTMPTDVSLAEPSIPNARNLQDLSGRLAPTDLRVDIAKLPPSERKALGFIVSAARLMDTVYLRQVWSGNEALMLTLAGDLSSLGRKRWHAFTQNKGPWLRLDAERPFLPAIGTKPPGANFYPEDATKIELEGWMNTLKPNERESALGFFSVIRRSPNGQFQVVPYSVEYQGELLAAATLLRQAAAATEDADLRVFLEGRARAFLTNEYRESDKAWMKLSGAIEPTIGPYEVYEDGWFNAKAAFEAFVTIRDDEATQRLSSLSGHLQDVEDHLPIEAALRNPKLGAMAPIRVVNSLFCSGDANRGVQTAAFNLPNDEIVTKELGAKRTLLKNIQEAKFTQVLMPIARITLAASDRGRVTFDAFFTHILMHELMHGLGPHQAGTQSVRAALQDTYSAIEEAKADVAGLFALQYLIDKGVLDRALEASIYPTYLASAFRSIRFGITEAHAKGIALQMNAFLDAGAFVVHADGTFSTDTVKMKATVVALTKELMTLQAAGDRTKAGAILRVRATMPPTVQRALARLTRVPVDIEPRFVTADSLAH